MRALSIINVPTRYYRQYDADYALEAPAEAFGGWDVRDLPLSLEHTAVAVMHAIDAGSREQYPGWFRCVEYIPRSYDIARTVFPGLLQAVRRSPLKLVHIAASGDYCRSHPGYRHQSAPEGETAKAETDPVWQELQRFRADHVFPGAHNAADVKLGRPQVDFLADAKPLAGETIVEASDSLFDWCRQEGINHLIYAGFAINGCLMISPGGIVDMSRRGIICSAFREAVTAIENKESVQGEWNKRNALWQVALLYGYVYEVDAFVRALDAI